MQFPYSKIGVCLLAFAAPDMGHASDAPLVAEIVSFRLTQDLTDAAFLKAAQTTQPFLAMSDGFIRRRLSKGEDGRWTDYIEWTDMGSAQKAAAHIMAQPEVAPFLDAIDPKTVDMRHERVIWQMD